MKSTETHQPLCTIELIAEGHAERCPGADCAYWENGCVLSRLEAELGGRPELAALLLTLRRELEDARHLDDGAALALFHRRLAAGLE